MCDNSLKCVCFLYIPAMTDLFERWLCKKALEGWRLEEIHGKQFFFRKCLPYATDYLSYTFFGNWSPFGQDFFAAKMQYSSKKSKLNKNKSVLTVFEVDKDKVDLQFYSLKIKRDLLYIKHYLGLLMYSIVQSLLSIYLAMENDVFLFFVVVSGLMIAYSLLSIAILAFETMRHRNFVSNLP